MAESDKALLIQHRDLPKVVDEAIKLAGERFVPISEGRLVRRWEILGRILRTDDLRLADDFAVSVAKRLGPAAQPALVKIDDRILAGFIERLDVDQFQF
jgi:hypothetical protein